MIDWMLRDRTTGRRTLVQKPNAPLVLWLATVVVRLLVHPHGAAGTVLHVVGTAALVVWAGDELARGVNPARRILGGVVLAAVMLSWFR
ncbi:MAG TPA: hypothetical protein VMZ11_05500 [Mycobacteriales bacterium]|nr:hypothetical protein [Mycobacteriales bacterium]